FYLPRPVHYPGNGIGGCQAQIIMAMTGKNGFVNTCYIFLEIFNFGTVLLREAIPRGIGYIKNGGPRLNDLFTDLCQEFIIRSSGILRIKFYVLYKGFGVFYSLYRPFDNSFP